MECCLTGKEKGEEEGKREGEGEGEGEQEVVGEAEGKREGVGERAGVGKGEGVGGDSVHVCLASLTTICDSGYIPAFQTILNQNISCLISSSALQTSPLESRLPPQHDLGQRVTSQWKSSIGANGG